MLEQLRLFKKLPLLFSNEPSLLPLLITHKPNPQLEVGAQFEVR